MRGALRGSGSDWVRSEAVLRPSFETGMGLKETVSGEGRRRLRWR